ncbi:hypothetical protein ACNKHT_18000 [Shigella flexneri]
MKPHWEDFEQADACLAATEWCRQFTNTSVAAVTLPASLRRRRPVHHDRVNMVKGLGTGTANRGRLERGIAEATRMTSSTNAPTRPGQPPGLHRASPVGPFTDVYSVMANWGANHGVLTIGHVGADFYHSRLHAAYPGIYAQRKRPKCIVLLPGLRTAWILKARITALAKLRPVVKR